MGYVKIDDWYNIKGDYLIQYGGSGLLHKYKNSPSEVVKAVFHTHQWQIWRFKTIPRARLTEPLTLKTYFDTLAPQLGVKQLEEWQAISFRQLQALGPCWHIKQLGLFTALRLAYPSYSWGVTNKNFTWTGTLASQHHVASLLQRHLPGVEVLENFKHTATQFDHSGNTMSIDVFIPSLSLGIEYPHVLLYAKLLDMRRYNGAQHYQDINSTLLGSASKTKKHDALKLAQFLSAKYTFVHIPWWWDGKFPSLQEIVS